MSIKILTFNIHHGRGLDGKLNLQRIVNVIKQSGAQIIGLNEVDKKFSWRSNYVDQIKWLAEALKMESAFSESLKKRNGYGAYGNALLSTYPIRSTKTYVISNSNFLVENRSLLEAQIQVGTEEINTFVTHLSLQKKFQKTHLEKLIELTKSSPRRIIIMGDFNMSEGDVNWGYLQEHFIDTANIKEKREPTFPAIYPRNRLDYIWVSKTDFTVNDVKVVKSNLVASDHLPLFAELSLK